MHDGGWAQLPGSSEKRYFLVAANAKDLVCVIDTVEETVLKPCVETGSIPHPGRGANFDHPVYGPVWASAHIGVGRLSMIGIDPEGHPDNAWKVVESVELKSAGSLFVKSNPNSNHVWIDFPLSSVAGVNGEVGVYNITTGAMTYLSVSGERVVHMDYNKAGNEVWVSGWLSNKMYIYDDVTLEIKHIIEDDWIIGPTGKFNVFNTMHDIY